MQRVLVALSLAACCLAPLHADAPKPAQPEPEAALVFPVEPDFTAATIDKAIIVAPCSVSTSCGSITLSCSGTISCTKVEGRCVSCKSKNRTSTQFCPGVDDETCGGTVGAFAVQEQGTE